MKSLPQAINNQVLGMVISAVVCLVCLLLPWATIVSDGGAKITIIGANWSFGMGFIMIPAWLLAILPPLGLIFAGLQAKGVIDIHRLSIVLAVGIVLPFTFIGLVLSFVIGTPHIGILLINAGVIMGISFASKGMRLAQLSEADWEFLMGNPEQ